MRAAKPGIQSRKQKVAGIGKGTAKDINEILETGTCGTLEDIRAG